MSSGLTGGVADIAARMRGLLPAGWFPDAAPVLDGVLAGMAGPLAQSYAQVTYLYLQARLATASDHNLDLIALDFFGPGGLERLGRELDDHYRERIQDALLAPRGTREAIVQVVANLTTTAPVIVEPGLATDTLVWDDPAGAWDVAAPWGDTNLPGQVFVTVLTPPQTVSSGVQGWDSGSWDTAMIAWQDDAPVDPLISDAEIHAAIASVLPINATAWVSIIPV